jgi:signal transduction histidine kinase
MFTTERRKTGDGRSVVVSAAHPVWLGDQVRGAVIVEETGNRVLAERNRAFERLFNIVLAVLLLGSVALTLFASRLSARIRRLRLRSCVPKTPELSARIRRLRDDAEQAIDGEGRARGRLASSDAGDEIGDLSRSFANALARLTDYASYQEKMASRLSHELRTPVAVVRSSLENLNAQPLPSEARVYIERAQGGLNRLAAILARMTEATRLEQALAESVPERYNAAKVVAGCVDGYRVAYPLADFALTVPETPVLVNGAPELLAQMLDKLVANAVEFSTGGPIGVALSEAGSEAILAVANAGPPLPAGMEGQLFDSIVSVRAAGGAAEPHLGLGLYIARLIAQFHCGHVCADNRADPPGVLVTVTLPLAGG